MKTRRASVPGHGWLIVPRYVVRLDSISKSGWIKNAGWQVRYRRPWKYFADSGERAGVNRNDRLGNPRASLKRAIAYLESIYRGDHSRLRAREKKNKRFHTGVVGVRYVERPKRGRYVAQYYVEVSPLHRHGVPKRFYVCTERTFTQAKLEAAWRRALEYRAAIIKADRDGS